MESWFSRMRTTSVEAPAGLRGIQGMDDVGHETPGHLDEEDAAVAPHLGHQGLAELRHRRWAREIAARQVPAAGEPVVRQEEMHRDLDVLEERGMEHLLVIK